MSALAYVLLTPDQVSSELKDVAGWQVEGGQLIRTFEFKTYKDGVVFATAVAHVADKLNHHPDITIGYAKVRIAVNTHDVGGLSPYDFELARRIEKL
ncbi:MAG: 4a-hydroxytetrahydrobiopterin dehydratase [Fimbriimonadaceae bacterium]|jgi:4a-hydroxytetrahydrobiopterin dehydratase|nr:4a-hydroxytetrahydrobiopterin dehydratase [Fimbriimonadaceae bacterium]